MEILLRSTFALWLRRLREALLLLQGKDLFNSVYLFRLLRVRWQHRH